MKQERGREGRRRDNKEEGQKSKPRTRETGSRKNSQSTNTTIIRIIKIY